MRNGIYALIALDGAPIARGDAAALGLAAQGLGEAEPLLLQAEDAAQPDAVQIAADAERTTILLGYLDAPRDVARSLGLPEETHPAGLARAALDRDGADAPHRLGGEWSLLDWTPRETVLLRSLAGRDPLLYAYRGAKLAVAPDLDRLARLPWVGRAIDPAGLVIAVGRHSVRAAGEGSTILAGVRTLGVGECVRLDATGARTARTAPFRPVTPFVGEFEDAMTQVDALLRRIMRERLARARGVACLLSGGLDSSLLTMLAAQERKVDQPLLCLCSAAPPGSGIADETGFAQIVADRLGLPVERVVPPLSASTYRPSEATMAGGNGPSLAPSEPLDSALHDRAAAHGLSLIFDGGFGEYTVTSYETLATPANRLRTLWHRVRRGNDPYAATSGLHVRLAPHRMAAAAAQVAETVRGTEFGEAARSPRARWGYAQGGTRILVGTTSYLAVRSDYPFRDPRLLALFASFPLGFVERGGLARAPARHLMRGHLPDSIRLRQIGMAYFPDRTQRLQADAPAARARIAAFRAAGLEDWVDLDWLVQQLDRIAAHGADAHPDATEVQITAMLAEYLLWWQQRP